MKYRYYFIAMTAMIQLAVGCNSASTKTKPQDDQLAAITTDSSGVANFNSPQADNKDEEKKIGDDKNKLPKPVNDVSSLNNNPDWDKKIIKTADIQLQIDDYKKFNGLIHSSIKNFGAYIANEKQTESDYRIENAITIKVPVDQFDNFINSFNADSIKVIEKNISSDDVTGEVVDTKSRMQAKMAVRDKYIDLLKQARNMNEILQVQDEINAIQEDIEAANGRVNYLQHASAYSTINLDYYQYINGTTIENEKPDFFTKLLKAFSTGTSVISNLVLFCISIWPIIIISLFGYFYIKRLKLKKAKA